MLGRPTDFLPRLHPNDVVYACGAPPMVGAIKAIAARAGVVCYADPFEAGLPDEAQKTAPNVRRREFIEWSSSRQIAQHVLQNPAIVDVANFFGRIDAAEDRHLLD